MSDPVGNPEDCFSQLTAYLIHTRTLVCSGTRRYIPFQGLFWLRNMRDKRTNGPVNAHLRSAVYTNDIENSPSIGADEALGPFFFSE